MNNESKELMGRNKALKAFRVFNRLTQKGLAEKLNLTKSFISEMENGKKPVTMQLVDRYAECFEVPDWEILYLGKAYENRLVGNRLTAKLLNLIDWITNDDAEESVKLNLKKKRKQTPQRRASDRSPKRRDTDRDTDLVGV